ncbi:hypothetical protein PGS50_17330 [Yersinia intermedia]|uniref:hypothetical protein n=1 Tax=Yersinia intermedia TaxID=631 RepID=UPI0022FE1024|nr:hypothetical protein [Yersinia intermedia]MDA5495002.1 hypothetical protein [Yersinia intermedia]
MRHGLMNLGGLVNQAGEFWLMIQGVIVMRKETVAQLLRIGLRHKLIGGDALCVMQYRPDRLGY